MEKEKWTLKDKLEIAEAVFTIIVSMMAIWGTLVAWENGFWHKLKHITDELHSRFEQNDINSNNNQMIKFQQELDKINNKLK